MYVIDELVKVIELLNFEKMDNKKTEKILKLREYLRKSSYIIQSNNQFDKIGELIGNLVDLYRALSIPKEELKEKDNNFNNKYYDTFRHIFYKEIIKVNDNNYKYK